MIFRSLEKSSKSWFDRATLMAKQKSSETNNILVYGAIVMMAALTIQTISDYKPFIGFIGIMISYVAIVTIVLADARDSRKTKIAKILGLPILLLLFANLYT